MASIKISELNDFSAVIAEDFIPLVDSSSLTTYRTSLDALGAFISASVPVGHATASISASYAETASFAETASYVNISAITIENATQAEFATQSLFATSSLYASQSAFATQSRFATQSLFSTQSLYATSSLTASYLTGSGHVSTLTASIAIRVASGSRLIIPMKQSLAYDNHTNCIFFQGGSNSGGPDPLKNDWGRLYFIEEVQDKGHIRFDHLDNNDDPYPLGPNIDLQYVNKPGFFWSTWDYSTSDSSSLMFLSTNGELYVRKVEATDFTASLVGEERVGFLGTSSWSDKAKTASYVDGALMPGSAKAWAYVIVPTASNYSTNTPADQITGNALNKPMIVAGHNISDVSWAGRDINPAVGFNTITDINTSFVRSFPYPYTQSYNGSTNVGNFIVTLTTAMSDTTYFAFGAGGEQGNEVFTVMTYPWARRTTTKFTASVRGTGDWSGYPENVWFQIVVY